jgi:hypothetical protein
MSTSPPRGPSIIRSASPMGLVHLHPSKMSIMSLARYMAASQTRHALCGFSPRTRTQVVASQPGQPQAPLLAAVPPRWCRTSRNAGQRNGPVCVCSLSTHGEGGVFDNHQTAGTTGSGGGTGNRCLHSSGIGSRVPQVLLAMRHTTFRLMCQTTLFLIRSTLRTSGPLTRCQIIQPASQWTTPPA